MGYYIRYSIKLCIPAKYFKKALEIFNHLHSDEMLLKCANSGLCGDIREGEKINEVKWYSFVRNPKTPYKTLKEAFENWGIVNEKVKMYIDDETYNFVVEGNFDNKWGQQDFLIEKLAPVLRNTIVDVTGEDHTKYFWIVDDGDYYSKVVRAPNLHDSFDDPVVESEHITPENLALAM